MILDKYVNETDKKELLKQFDTTYINLHKILEPYQKSSLSIVSKWFKGVFDYNIPNGKKNRGLACVFAYIIIQKHANSQYDWKMDEKLTKAMIVGWCIEMMQAFFLILDDIMDESITRRDQPCWYKNKEVGNIAINDAIFIESSIFTLLKKYISDDPCYLSMLELFLEIINRTEMGQCFDTLQSRYREIQSDAEFKSYFTLERYETIVKYKTIYYSFYLPILAALHLTGYWDESNVKTCKRILYYMGYYFQVQDDYLDCFGEPEVIGKIGTDIQDFKCSWLIVNAVEKASQEQAKILLQNYGKKSDEKETPVAIERVKQVYRDIGLPELFIQFETHYHNLIQSEIENLYDGNNYNTDIVENHHNLENNIESSKRLKQNNHGDSVDTRFFVGTSEEIPDGNIYVKEDSPKQAKKAMPHIPKDVFTYYAELIYKRIK